MSKQKIDTEFLLKSVTEKRCSDQLSEFFRAICEESPEIKSNWEEVSGYIHPNNNVLPIEIYEKEVVPNVSMILDRFEAWDIKTKTDNRFLIQAMVNKIALPLWMIMAICYANIQIQTHVLDNYCKIRVDFDFHEGSPNKWDSYRLHIYTLKKNKVKDFNWREFLDSIVKSSITERSHAKSILETSLVKKADIIRMYQIFEYLMEQSHFESKVAKYFWQYLDEVLTDNCISDYFLTLPRIDPN
mgnify:CR=1 FL=1